MTLFWIDGHLVEKEQAAIHPCDHGLLYGDGVRIGWRCARGEAIFLDNHLDDLFAAAAQQYLDLPLSRADFHSAVAEVIQANRRQQGYGCIVVTRGAGGFGPDPRKLDPRVLVWVEDYRPFPTELAEYGLHAVTVSVAHHDPYLLGDPHVVRAKHQALRHGCLEAVLLDSAERVLGTTEGTLFFRCSDRWVLPEQQKPDPHARLVYRWLKEQRLQIQIVAAGLKELLGADEMFIAGVSVGVVPLLRLDGQSVGSGVAGETTRAARIQWEQMTSDG